MSNRSRWIGSLNVLLVAAATTAIGCVGGDASDEGGVEDSESALASVDVNNLIKLLQKRDSTKGHPVANLDVGGSQPCGSIETDSGNALMNAVVFAESTSSDRAKYGKAAAQILADWAHTNKSFTNANGFLCAAWNVGAMARAAYILSSRGAAQSDATMAKQLEDFKAWAVHVASTYLLPKGDKAPQGAKPEVLSSWELAHVTNRTMVSLEATLHIARFAGDTDWMQDVVGHYKTFVHYQDFKGPQNENGDSTRYFLDASGKNNDDGRGDDWHRTAGLASSVQICEIAKADLGEDLFGFNNGILLKSLEHYGSIELSHLNGAAPPPGGKNSTIIPFWDVAARAFPGSKTVAALAQKQAGKKGSSYVPDLVNYSWGFGRYLDPAGG